METKRVLPGTKKVSTWNQKGLSYGKNAFGTLSSTRGAYYGTIRQF
jgi:hypothetical protein